MKFTDFIKLKFQNDKIFHNGDFNMFSETVFSVSGNTIKREKYYSVSEHIEKVTTIQAILKYSEQKNIIALNFANAMFAGGGYILGGDAQEESLCRASMLYYTIRTQKKYYRANRFHILPDYTDNMIYSRNVPIIRDDSGKLLDNPSKCDFITCPAVNRTFAKFIFTDKKINDKMTVRINKIISLAVSNKPDVIILGAFGCGVFGNKRETVFRIFENAVNSFVSDDIKVIFAVPDFRKG